MRLAYNVAWLAGLLLTGMGTLALAWHATRHRASAVVAGLLAMLSGPVLVHAHAHLELIYVGSFALFLLAWMRLIDRPGPGRLAAAVGGYVLTAMGAAYFLVLSIVPAVLYVAWGATREGRRGAWPWLRDRSGWILGFGAACLPVLVLLFAGHLAAALGGSRSPVPEPSSTASAPRGGATSPRRRARCWPGTSRATTTHRPGSPARGWPTSAR